GSSTARRSGPYPRRSGSSWNPDGTEAAGPRRRMHGGNTKQAGGRGTRAGARSRPLRSGDLEQPGGTHAAADAHRDDGPLAAAALAFDQRMAGQALSADTVRMADGDRAAVDVQALVRDPEPVAAVEHLDGEGFVQLPEVDVVDFQAGTVEQLGHREHRADPHLVGFAAGDREAAEIAERLQPLLLGQFRLHDDAGTGAVGELARVAGRNGPAGQRAADRGDRLECRAFAAPFVVG